MTCEKDSEDEKLLQFVREDKIRDTDMNSPLPLAAQCSSGSIQFAVFCKVVGVLEACNLPCFVGYDSDMPAVLQSSRADAAAAAAATAAQLQAQLLALFVEDRSERRLAAGHAPGAALAGQKLSQGREVASQEPRDSQAPAKRGSSARGSSQKVRLSPCPSQSCTQCPHHEQVARGASGPEAVVVFRAENALPMERSKNSVLSGPLCGMRRSASAGSLAQTKLVKRQVLQSDATPPRSCGRVRGFLGQAHRAGFNSAAREQPVQSTRQSKTISSVAALAAPSAAAAEGVGVAGAVAAGPFLEACHLLGRSSSSGGNSSSNSNNNKQRSAGGSQDQIRGLELLRQAAQQQNVDALQMLGSLYRGEEPVGTALQTLAGGARLVRPDVVQASRYLSHACALLRKRVTELSEEKAGRAANNNNSNRAAGGGEPAQLRLLALAAGFSARMGHLLGLSRALDAWRAFAAWLLLARALTKLDQQRQQAVALRHSPSAPKANLAGCAGRSSQVGPLQWHASALALPEKLRQAEASVAEAARAALAEAAEAADAAYAEAAAAAEAMLAEVTGSAIACETWASLSEAAECSFADSAHSFGPVGGAAGPLLNDSQLKAARRLARSLTAPLLRLALGTALRHWGARAAELAAADAATSVATASSTAAGSSRPGARLSNNNNNLDSDNNNSNNNNTYWQLLQPTERLQLLKDQAASLEQSIFLFEETAQQEVAHWRRRVDDVRRARFGSASQAASTTCSHQVFKSCSPSAAMPLAHGSQHCHQPPG
ncbi:unnamed protein product, partial [Polarella glacialis]